MPKKILTRSVVADPDDVETGDIVQPAGDEEQGEIPTAHGIDGGEDNVADQDHREAKDDERAASAIFVGEVRHDEEHNRTENVDRDGQELSIHVRW